MVKGKDEDGEYGRCWCQVVRRMEWLMQRLLMMMMVEAAMLIVVGDGLTCGRAGSVKGAEERS